LVGQNSKIGDAFAYLYIKESLDKQTFLIAGGYLEYLDRIKQISPKENDLNVATFEIHAGYGLRFWPR